MHIASLWAVLILLGEQDGQVALVDATEITMGRLTFFLKQGTAMLQHRLSSDSVDLVWERAGNAEGGGNSSVVPRCCLPYTIHPQDAFQYDNL